MEENQHNTIPHPLFPKLIQKDTLVDDIEGHWEIKKNKYGCTIPIHQYN